MAYNPYGTSKKNRRKPNWLAIGGISALLLWSSRKQEAASAKTPNVSNLKLTYYQASTNEVRQVNVMNGSSYSGNANGLQLDFTESSGTGASVRITYEASKDGNVITADTRTLMLNPGEAGTFNVEPTDYGGTAGVDTVQFFVEVLPPQTGGTPEPGQTYPSVAFTYRL
jgi:hypothetical protein